MQVYFGGISHWVPDTQQTIDVQCLSTFLISLSWWWRHREPPKSWVLSSFWCVVRHKLRMMETYPAYLILDEGKKCLRNTEYQIYLHLLHKFLVKEVGKVSETLNTNSILMCDIRRVLTVEAAVPERYFHVWQKHPWKRREREYPKLGILTKFWPVTHLNLWLWRQKTLWSYLNIWYTWTPEDIRRSNVRNAGYRLHLHTAYRSNMLHCSTGSERLQFCSHFCSN